MPNLFKRVFKKVSTSFVSGGKVVINGTEINGNNVEVMSNGDVIVDGLKYDSKSLVGDEKVINIKLVGDVLSVENECGDLEIHGDVENVESSCGNVTVNGGLHGKVDVSCGNIYHK